MTTLKDHVSNNKFATFQYFQSGSLYYETELGLIFEVPVSDTGNGIFATQEKAINMMRWIRPQIEKNEKAKAECLNATF